MTIQLSLFPETAHLVRIAPDRNEWRFYRLALCPDLFGGCALLREWGRIGAGGRLRVDWHGSEGEALNALARLARAKRRRGYRDAGLAG